MKALIVGYGKMGKAIETVLIARGHRIAGRFGRGEICLEGEEGKSDLWSASMCDIALDFTAPDSAAAVVSLLLSKKIPVLSGTTGWDVDSVEHLAREQEIPFLHSSNFSIGVAALKRAVAAAAAALAAFPEFEPGIVERHHSKKKDSPSGTAKLLAEVLEEASGRVGVPIASLRQGGAPGEHLVFFEGESETLELVHRARSRAIFALGAVRAAEWMLESGRTGPLTFDDFFTAAAKTGASHGNGGRSS